MNFNNFTIKSQEAVQEAVNLTQTRGQQAIEPVHLLAGVLKVGENVTNFIFQKLGMNAQQVTLVIDKQIDSLPKVSGGEPYLSRESNEVLQRATQYSKEMGDEYVSLEAIILALLNVKSTVSTILKDAGMTDKDLRAAITELRKGEKVTSQSSEDTYQSLSKYAINLNEYCPQCKAPASKFTEMCGDRTWAAEHIVGIAKDVAEDIKMDLRANFTGECTEVGMYLAMSRVAHREGYPEIGMYWEKAAFEEAEHAAKFAELLGEVVTDSTKKNLEMRVDAEHGATEGKFDLAKRAKAANLNAIHDTVHEMARDEARHGKAFEGLLKRYFG